MADKEIRIKESELRQLVGAIVRQELAGMLGLGSQDTQPEEEWLETSAAAKALNTTAAKLNAKRRSGWFKKGVHYAIDNINPRATGQGVRYRYHIERCRSRLAESPSKWLKGS